MTLESRMKEGKMSCPACHKLTDTTEVDSRFFVGRNSAGIPFFKCEECGNLFIIDENNGTSHIFHRSEGGCRFVPVSSGILAWIIACVIFWFLGSNIMTWIIGGVLLYWGGSSIRVGLWGSQKLIDEMTMDGKLSMSQTADEEWRKLHKAK